MKLGSIASALFAVALSAGAAAPTVIYETGFETAPASPAWAAGNVYPQNGWQAWVLQELGTFNPASFQVVGNGLPEAVIGGQAVVTPYGSQFHRFTASSSATADNYRFVYRDIAATVAALPATHKVIKSSMDFFVPSTQVGVAAGHGFIAYHSNDTIPWAVLLDPSDRSVNLFWDDLATISSGDLSAFGFKAAAFEFDTWFNVTVTANYSTAQLSITVDGVELTSLTRIIPELSAGALTDVDLATWNWDWTAPALRSIAGDNFRMTAEPAILVRPTLTIAPIPPDNIAYRIKWPAVNANWILEYTDDLVVGGSIWSAQGNPPEVDADPLFVHVDVALEALHRYFRLRQP